MAIHGFLLDVILSVSEGSRRFTRFFASLRMTPSKSIAIIGVGNYLMSDEGAGIHAIAGLREMEWPENVDVIDGGTPGVALLHMIEGRKLVIIIDCADFEGTPGEIRTFDAEELARDENDEISLHATDLLGALELGKRTENYPDKVIIVGIQPKTIEMGTTLSDEASSALEQLPETLRQIIE